MTHHTPEGLPPLPKPDSFLFQHEDTGNTQFVDGQQVEWGFEEHNPHLQKIGGAYTESQMQAYAREALAAQAASVEPVASVLYLSDTGLCSEISEELPWGMALYAGAPPAPASVQNASLVEKLAKRTCEANADSARFTIALQTLRASLDPDDWMGAVTMHNYIDAVLAGGSPLSQPPAVAASSPAQAVDAVDELREALMGLLASGGVIADASPDELQAALSDPESEPIVKTQAAAVLRARAALQASSQPQAQQGAAGPLKLNVCHSQNASQTPQADLSLVTAPQEWSPAYTRGPARQSAPVAAVPALVTDAALIRELVDHIERNTCTHEGTHRGGAIWEVCDSCGARWADDEGGKPEFKWPAVVEKARAILALRPERVPLTEEQMVSAVRPLCNTDQVAERLVAVSIDEYRAIEAASAKLNGLTVGDGGQG